MTEVDESVAIPHYRYLFITDRDGRTDTTRLPGDVPPDMGTMLATLRNGCEVIAVTAVNEEHARQQRDVFLWGLMDAGTIVPRARPRDGR